MTESKNICLTCGKEFASTSGNILCPRCKAKVESSKRYTLKTCQRCGRKFWGNNKAKYCALCRPEVARERAHQAYVDGAKRHIGTTDICPICGKEYVVESANQKRCPDCRQTYTSYSAPGQKERSHQNYIRRRDSMTPEEKEMYLAREREKDRKRRQNHIRRRDSMTPEEKDRKRRLPELRKGLVQYAVYDKGHNFIISGTAQEIAEHMGIKIGTVYSYMSRPGKYTVKKI